MLDEFREECDRLYDEQQEQQAEGGMAIVARCYEQATKLALLYACSESPDPSITRSAVEWSCRFVRRQTEVLLASAAERVHASEYDRQCNRILAKLKANPEGITHSVLLGFSKLKGWEFREIIGTLDERKQIRIEATGTVNTKTNVYWPVLKGE